MFCLECQMMKKVQKSDYYKRFILHIAALDILYCISVYRSTDTLY
jgi:hypothetical protein